MDNNFVQYCSKCGAQLEWSKYFDGYYCNNCNSFFHNGVEKCRVYKDCINKDTDICHQCSHEPGWKSRADYFQNCAFACPIGMIDCIWDPAYMKRFNPEWYEALCGNMTITEVVEKCCKPYIVEQGNWCRAYDNEDK